MESIKIIIEGHVTIITNTINNKTEITISLNNSLSSSNSGNGILMDFPVNYHIGDR